jgi:hypothetical protein
LNQLYFLHIPKTAGSFINYSISKELNKNNILNYSHQVDSNFPHSIDFDNISFLGAHFAASPLVFNPNFYVACILRDPLERSISYFNFTYHIYRKKYKDKNTYKERLIEYLFNDPDTRILDNVQSKFICNQVEPDIFNPKNSRESIERNYFGSQFCWFLQDIGIKESFVKKQIDSFDIVGTVENIGQFCDKLHDWFYDNYKISINFDIDNKVNKTEYPVEDGIVYNTRAAIECLTPAEIASFKINNFIDYNIYDYVRSNEISRP